MATNYDSSGFIFSHEGNVYQVVTSVMLVQGSNITRDHSTAPLSTELTFEHNGKPIRVNTSVDFLTGCTGSCRSESQNPSTPVASPTNAKRSTEEMTVETFIINQSRLPWYHRNVQQMLESYSQLDAEKKRIIIEDANRLFEKTKEWFCIGLNDEKYALKEPSLIEKWGNMQISTQIFLNALKEKECGMKYAPVSNWSRSIPEGVVVVPMADPNNHKYPLNCPHEAYGNDREMFNWGTKKRCSRDICAKDDLRMPDYAEIVALVVARME
jgi:hypothetical protein